MSNDEVVAFMPCKIEASGYFMYPTGRLASGSDGLPPPTAMVSRRRKNESRTPDRLASGKSIKRKKIRTSEKYPPFFVGIKKNAFIPLRRFEIKRTIFYPSRRSQSAETILISFLFHIPLLLGKPLGQKKMSIWHGICSSI